MVETRQTSKSLSLGSLGQNQSSTGSAYSLARSSWRQDFWALYRSDSALLARCFSRIWALGHRKKKFKLSCKEIVTITRVEYSSLDPIMFSIPKFDTI